MKRPVLTILIFLLLLSGGAIVNVAVAWAAIAYWQQANLEFDEPVRTGRAPLDHDERIGTLQWWAATVSESTAVSQAVTRVYRLPGPIGPIDPDWLGDEPDPEDVLPRWADPLRVDRDNRGAAAVPPISNRTCAAVGWPMRSLRCVYTSGGAGPVDGAFVIGTTPQSRPFMLPYDILWPGFAVNAIFYGVILLGLWLAARQTRRAMRRRRGLCVNCAYPRGESAVCTECGAALPEIKRA